MKKVMITLLCLSVSAIAANAQNEKKAATAPIKAQTATAPTAAVAQKPQAAPTPPPPNPNAGKFAFKEETHNFGEVPEGPQAETDFEFTNTGKEPIKITEAHGSCGCTVPKWPNEPILPGKTAAIHVTYNTSGRPGPITKEVTITSNAQQSPMVLHIRGTVKPKPAAPAATPTPAPTPAPAPTPKSK